MPEPNPPTFWHATTELTAYPQFEGDACADVAVIGGGFTGLSAALRLAERGASVVLLEAHSIAFGASGRNAGFVVPNFSKADPTYVASKLGEEKGQKLLRLVAQGGDRVFEIARQYGIEDAQRSGWLQPAHSLEMAEVVRKRVEAWQLFGRPVEWLDAEEARKRTGIRLYQGALFDRSGGTINPVAYAHGLARGAAALGARIYEQSSVTAVEAEANGWRVVTPAGSVRAGHVLLCTNAFGEGPAERLGRTTIPLQVYQIATEPLDAAVIARFSPRREPMSDTRANIFSYRLTRDNRLISGGMAILPLGAERRMARTIADRLACELRLPSVPRADYIWRGTAAVTTDFLPHLYKFGQNFIGATGCNGRGIAMTTMFGDVLADAVLGSIPLDQLAVPLMPAETVPFRKIARAAPSFFLIRGLMSDRRAITRAAHKPSSTAA
ncbi:NAD(P)/FAD-dependent oxidoreductase [Rhizobium terrae]|uniref:NAD(P)/FAD-dependent oxidoreductase n=1 Tax=Rhizobium terrae TaxID=2171756 RepID=UPI000E3EDEF1|nr:FAD-dependent oxidoreductase [Rhizobium terrae]